MSLQSEEICISCRRPKAEHHCEICQEAVCRSCVQFLEAGTFSFLPKLPDDLKHTYYCQNCHAEKVEPALASYEETLETARNTYFFFSTQKRSLPVLKKSQEKVRVEGCEDRDETILRLAFLAALQGCNAIIEAEVTSEKIRNAGYQTSKWRGVGVPALLDAERLERRGR